MEYIEDKAYEWKDKGGVNKILIYQKEENNKQYFITERGTNVIFLIDKPLPLQRMNAIKFWLLKIYFKVFKPS